MWLLLTVECAFPVRIFNEKRSGLSTHPTVRILCLAGSLDLDSKVTKLTRPAHIRWLRVEIDAVVVRIPSHVRKSRIGASCIDTPHELPTPTAPSQPSHE